MGDRISVPQYLTIFYPQIKFHVVNEVFYLGSDAVKIT
jgi:hypothetical protein